jgi:hypothetical protein
MENNVVYQGDVVSYTDGKISSTRLHISDSFDKDNVRFCNFLKMPVFTSFGHFAIGKVRFKQFL